jgi:hypothetical protein
VPATNPGIGEAYSNDSKKTVDQLHWENVQFDKLKKNKTKTL